MKVISLVLILAGCAFAQGKFMMSGSVSRAGVHVLYRTLIEPPSNSEEVNLGGGVASSRELWHRYLYHSKTRRYLGYDILIQRKQPDEYSVTLLRLTADAKKLGLESPGEWTLVPLPRAPGPEILRAGQTVAVDLLVNPATGQKVVDYLTIRDDQREVHTAEGPVRAFTAEEAPLNLQQPRVSVNGELVPATADVGGGVSGTAVAFYLPGKGRFVLSLAPREQLGFRRAGETRGSSASFSAGSDTYRIECNGRIAPGDNAYYLYLFHNPSYRPKAGAAADAFMMEAGEAVWLVKR